MESIYLDHSATTALHPRVLAVMTECLERVWGNTSSIHQHGLEAKERLEMARQQVAAFIGASAGEIVFTSSGTEANNAALWGLFQSSGKKHLVVSAIEHPSVLECARGLRRFGVEIAEAPVDAYGRVDPEQVRRLIRPDTFLVSIMLASNLVGTIQPIEQISAITRQLEVPLHVDAVQAAGHLPLEVERLGADLLTISAHKIYGPKGAAALYVRRGLAWEPLLRGGHHENRRRAGTVNLPAVAGFGEACRLAAEELEERCRHDAFLRDLLQQGLEKLGVRILGHPTLRVPHILCACFCGWLGEMVLLELDRQGIRVSTGSACTSGQASSAYVLEAMGLSEEEAASAVRFSLGRENTPEHIERTLQVINAILKKG
jgi:cysteine desulfurase